MTDEKKYWVAHVRGPNYDQLRKKGFLVLYPDVDDYVFLEVTEANQKLLKKQLELAVAFLKTKGKFNTVTETEVKRMSLETSTERIAVGAEIEVINGYCDNMEGKVLEVDGDRIRASLRGYNRTYDVELDRLDVIAKGQSGEKS